MCAELSLYNESVMRQNSPDFFGGILWRYRFSIFAVVFAACFVVSAQNSVVHAQATSRTDAAASTDQNQHFYEKLTFPKVSQLYWALNKFGLRDDAAIDSYMMINECDIYQNYARNEFEWKNIRESGRQYIKNNIKDFPTRFEIIQPLNFAEYDFEQQVFDVWQPYKIDNIRLLEVVVPGVDEKICGTVSARDLPSYPKKFVTELARPISVVSVKVPQNKAKYFIEQSNKRISARDQNNNAAAFDSEKRYQARQAFLVLKVKYFALSDEDAKKSSASASDPIKILAVLEELEIFGDKNRKFLLYKEQFRKQSGQNIAVEMLKKRVEARLGNDNQQPQDSKDESPKVEP